MQMTSVEMSLSRKPIVLVTVIVNLSLTPCDFVHNDCPVAATLLIMTATLRHFADYTALRRMTFHGA